MRGRALRTGTTVVTVTFKNIKTAKSTAKKYRCVVKAALEPEKPVEPEVVKATKITEAKAASAKTISVSFDGVVDTSSATAIKVARGTTAITVTPKYADDMKSVVLTSDTSLAAGTYTVTVGSFEPVSFNVVKQTPTTMNIVNTTVANKDNARVYFQVLDQYGDVMSNYTNNKLVINAYNVTKGHEINWVPQSKKADYFTLNCSTETTSPSGGFLNSVGDKVSVVVYLQDNASVSCKAELEIVRVYTNELTFGDVKLGDDKRVTKNRTYELTYTAKDTEGKDVTFDEKKPVGGSHATVGIDNYNFISSNVSAIDMGNVYVDADGKLKFVAGNTAGTAVITAINTITGETTSTTIVVNSPAQLSSLDIADASVACDAKKGDKFKALVTAYDQFGEVIDAKNVKNVSLRSGSTLGNVLYFNSITATPAGDITINKITSDGKYVEYEVTATDMTSKKGQKVTFNFISKEMGETGYIKASSVVTIDDEIEASALEIVKAPAATVSEGGDVKVQIAVKDQYQNKLVNKTGLKFGEAGQYDITIKDTNDVVTYDSISDVKGEDKVYEIKLKAGAADNIYKTGTFTLQLEDDGKIVASKLFNLVVVKTITKYGIDRDKGTYKAGDTIKVDVNAYSGSSFNAYYNDSVTADIVVSQGGVVAKKYTKSLTFKDGIASFELTAGKEANNYEIIVTNQNDYDGTHYASGTSDKFNVVSSDAGKLIVNSDGKLQITDSQENAIGAWKRNAFATIKVMDDTKNADITGSSKIASTNGNWDKKNDNTVEVEIGSTNVVSLITAGGSLADYDMGNLVVTVPDTSKDHIILLSITINGFTWEKKVDANGSTSVDFAAGSTAGNRYLAEVGAKADLAKIRTIMTGASVSGASVTSSASIRTSDLVSSSAVKITATAERTSGAGFTVTGCGFNAITASTVIGFDYAPSANVSQGAIVKVVYDIEVVNTQDVGGNNEAKNTQTAKYEVEYEATADGGANWKTTVKKLS